jgi:ketosteroid isomerase-like protein
MDIVQRFLGYAAAFEKAYETDDWSHLDPFFTEDAVYETLADPPFGNRNEGLEAVKAGFKQAVAGFDRRFDSRAVEMVEGPIERDGNVWFRWVATYTLAGAPPLRMQGEETAVFAGDRIRRLEDRISAAEGQQVMAYMAEHGGKLKP